MNLFQHLPLLMIVGFALSAPGWSQDAASGATTTFSAQTRLVMVPVVVRDKHRALINGLAKESFALEVDGKAQAIKYFDHDNDVPLTVGLLVDTSMSQRTVLDDERMASARFLETMLTAGRDKAYVIQFARSVTLLEDVTDSKPKLREALQQVSADTRPSFSDASNDGGSGGADSNGGGGRRHGGGGGGTMLYDSVFLASEDVSAKVKGRRAVILLTDGDDTGSKVSLARAIEAAQKADTTVYAIYYEGERPDHGGGQGNT